MKDYKTFEEMLRKLDSLENLLDEVLFKLAVIYGI